MVKSLDRLMAIADNHPDFAEPGVEEGLAGGDMVNRVDDLRYYLAYLKQALRPQGLEQSLSQQPELTLTTLGDTIDQLEDIAITLIPRLRDNIARKAPQLNCPKLPEFDPNLSKTSIKPEEFRRRLENGERHFERLSLSCVDLRGLDLKHLVLTDSELSGCDLSYASLFQANLSRTKLDRANLTGAFLNGANLFQASLIGCNLSHCHAIDVNFSQANLSHANLTWTNLSGANLSGTNLSGANLSGANLEEANLDDSWGRD